VKSSNAKKTAKTRKMTYRGSQETIMVKELRESKELSQGDIEKRTGLLRCYISRLENGHTVPAIETFEKMARALEVPIYRLFHDREVPASLSKLKPPKDDEFGRRSRLPVQTA
jgi:transcriptional regulator with XRE-family HTH domain